jgi:hypothetical protein
MLQAVYGIKPAAADHQDQHRVKQHRKPKATPAKQLSSAAGAAFGSVQLARR